MALELETSSRHVVFNCSMPPSFGIECAQLRSRDASFCGHHGWRLVLLPFIRWTFGWSELLAAKRQCPVKALQPGEPFLFKLYSPHDFVVRWRLLQPLHNSSGESCLEVLRTRERRTDEQEMRARVEHYRRVTPNPTEDYTIGCILPQSPFFFQRNDWVHAPDWSRSIVRGERFRFWDPARQITLGEGESALGIKFWSCKRPRLPQRVNCGLAVRRLSCLVWDRDRSG